MWVDQATPAISDRMIDVKEAVRLSTTKVIPEDGVWDRIRTACRFLERECAYTRPDEEIDKLVPILEGLGFKVVVSPPCRSGYKTVWIKW